MSLKTTSSQTVGPYLHIGLTWLVTDNLVGSGVTGDPVTIEGRITDVDARPVDDALVEIWQANAHGRYDHPEDTRNLPLEAGFKGFGRMATDASGGFRFTTIKPGRVPAADDSMQAPHINVTVLARGLLTHQITRIYFADEALTASDPVLALVPDEAGRRTLIAHKVAGGGETTYRFDIRLQGDGNGDGETVFFEC